MQQGEFLTLYIAQLIFKKQEKKIMSYFLQKIHNNLLQFYYFHITQKILLSELKF